MFNQEFFNQELNEEQLHNSTKYRKSGMRTMKQLLGIGSSLFLGLGFLTPMPANAQQVSAVYQCNRGGISRNPNRRGGGMAFRETFVMYLYQNGTGYTQGQGSQGSRFTDQISYSYGNMPHHDTGSMVPGFFARGTRQEEIPYVGQVTTQQGYGGYVGADGNIVYAEQRESSDGTITGGTLECILQR